LGSRTIACSFDTSRYALMRDEDQMRRLVLELVFSAQALSGSPTIGAIAGELTALPDAVQVDCPPWPPFSGRCASVMALGGETGNRGEPATLRLKLELEQIAAQPSNRVAAGSHLVQPGESLASIAHAHFGDASRWREIALLNDISDPMRLEPGEWLRLGSTREEGVDDAGSGLAFPVHVDMITGGVAVSHAETDIEEAVAVILDTRPGERVMRPDFGCAVHALTFDTMSAAAVREINRLVLEAIQRWEPRVHVLGIQSDVSEWRSGTLRVAIEYRVGHTRQIRSMRHAFRVVKS
jgi:phage baseplate assembly protein W